jgi:hypothetical protein
MPITSDTSVFINKCIKNDAVDYKVLYENKCKECEELKKKLDAENEPISEEEQSELLKSIMDYIVEKQNEINKLIKENEELKKKVDAEKTADMINKLNDEFDEINDKWLKEKNKNEELKKENEEMIKKLFWDGKKPDLEYKHIELIAEKIKMGWSEDDFIEKLGIGMVGYDELDSLLSVYLEGFKEWEPYHGLEEKKYCFSELDDPGHFVDYLIGVGEVETDGIMVGYDYYYVIPDM